MPIVASSVSELLAALSGVGLLLLAIHIPGPTAFASFRSVLLLTTLFRLSLSIAITRLILIDAEDGPVWHLVLGRPLGRHRPRGDLR